MSVMAMAAGRGQPEPETLEREAAVPKEWEAALDRQENFIEELCAGEGTNGPPKLIGSSVFCCVPAEFDLLSNYSLEI
ncbi:hypothetical protein [Celeribacter baekdonensis]|jgi:hypothetical protein|nr:hypothetical protein [Celeribacter baekdonensis]